MRVAGSSVSVKVMGAGCGSCRGLVCTPGSVARRLVRMGDRRAVLSPVDQGGRVCLGRARVPVIEGGGFGFPPACLYNKTVTRSMSSVWRTLVAI